MRVISLVAQWLLGIAHPVFLTRKQAAGRWEWDDNGVSPLCSSSSTHSRMPLEDEVSKGWGDCLSVPTSYNQYFGLVLSVRGKCIIACYIIVLLAGWHQSKWRVQERHYKKKRLASSSSMLSLSSAAQAPWAHLTRSWRLPPGSAQQCSASSITFSWKWSFPFLWGRIIQSHWGGTTTTQLAGTKPRAL